MSGMTAATPVRGVRLLGQGVPYLDGAEDRLHDVLVSAVDRSTDSNELAAHITDWPSRYHLSRLRPNLLMPLRINAGMRVLDIGCGTGVLTRSLAERGANVTGLEGSLARARAAGARTAGMLNAEIVCGSLEEYATEGHRDEFDLILVCGVLEYSVSMLGGEGGPAQMLEQANSLLKPDGVIAVAIENQLGLKYLLSYPEDHRGLPWVGIDGYRSGRNPARTWSRKALGEMLANSGLTQQQWLYPYPDYKMTTVVAHSDLFDTREGTDLLRLFIRTPVQDYAHPSILTADSVSAFRSMLEAGIGRDTANSFLVVAGRDDSKPSQALADGMLWISSGERAAEFMERRVLQRSEEGFVLKSIDGRPQVHIPPLVSARSTVPVILGENLEDEIVLLAARCDGLAELEPLLREWWQTAGHHLNARAVDGVNLDVAPRNFIRGSNGSLTFIDHEWAWTDEVPSSWLLLRSLWLLVLQRLWPAGAMAGLSWSLNLGEAVLALARLVEPQLRDEELDAAVVLEAQLQARVQAMPSEREHRELRHLLDRPLMTLSARPSMAQLLESPIIAREQATERVNEARLQELAARDEVAGQSARLETLEARLDEALRANAWLRQRTQPRALLGKAKSRATSKVKRLLA
jgi:2-polyprenyl-3-methyl-5-hydroxy-6-metoxy-1,4-benzoquinol methylase